MNSSAGEAELQNCPRISTIRTAQKFLAKLFRGDAADSGAIFSVKRWARMFI